MVHARRAWRLSSPVFFAASIAAVSAPCSIAARSARLTDERIIAAKDIVAFSNARDARTIDAGDHPHTD